MPDVITILLFFVILALAILVFFLFKKNQLLEKKTDELLFSKSSQSVRYGKTSEQFMPFMKGMPFDAGSFRFIGSPVDGIAFSEKEIIFCEFKTGTSMLSEKQQKIKSLVEQKKVKWLEVKI